MTEESLTGLLLAAVALSLERVAYVWIWRNPDEFSALSRRGALAVLGEPVDAVRRLFYGFKLIQCLVFGAWIAFHGGWLGGSVPVFLSERSGAIALGLGLIAAGQTLNFAVFRRLGRIGVFYGNRFGHEVPWVHGFPFSVLTHPQYVGTVASIWGLFLATRFPHADWIALPLLETLYYVVGARLESQQSARQEARCDAGDEASPALHGERSGRNRD